MPCPVANYKNRIFFGKNCKSTSLFWIIIHLISVSVESPPCSPLAKKPKDSIPTPCSPLLGSKTSSNSSSYLQKAKLATCLTGANAIGELFANS